MSLSTSLIRLGAAVCALGTFAALAAPASAEIAVEGGGFFGGTGTAGGAAVSLGVFSPPLVPISTDITVAAPLTSGGRGYATTFDARFHPTGTTIGAGIGFGTIGNTSSTSVIYDGIVAQSIAPHTALEGRVYFGPNRPSTVFAGLRFAF